MAMSIFHLYIASPLGKMPSNKVRAIHLGFVLALIFLLFPAFKGKTRGVKTMISDYILSALGIFVIYLFFNIDAISMRAGVMNGYCYGYNNSRLVLEATEMYRSH